MVEKANEAKTELQRSIYGRIAEIFEAITIYLAICSDDKTHFEEIYSKATGLIEVFNVRTLAPIMLFSFYIVAAQGYMAHENRTKALEILKTYTDIVTGEIFPLLPLKGDDFFNLIGDMTDDLSFGMGELPRDEKAIRQSMADAIINNPVFSALADEPSFRRITEKLKHNIGRDL
jgi:hypothetical protein